MHRLDVNHLLFNQRKILGEEMMIRSRRKILQSTLALPVVLALPRASWSQVDEYPNREIHSICMFPAGTGADIIVRYYSRKLQDLAGKPVVVENRIGAAGNIATEYVARSKPDGYTVFIAPASSIIPPARFLFKQLGYDPDKDLASVALLATLPFILFVAGDSPIKTVPELVDYLRKKGDQSSYGSSTTVGQVCAEMFKEKFGLKTMEVKYRSGLDGLNELIKHQLDFYFTDPGTTKGMVADGRLRPLMVTTARRSSALSDLPSARECGVTNLDLESWWSVHVPAGTPAAIIRKLAGWIDQFAASDETKKFLADTTSAEPLLGGAKAVDDLMAKDRVKWADYVRIAKIEPQ
jgi:tripartite-type tricarboxylate transporter receptor subunit TctC